MTHSRLAAAILVALFAQGAAHAAETSVTIELATQSDFQRRVIIYDCAEAEPLSVTYINAAPNFLALVPIAEEAEAMVFTAVMAASGVRYTAGKWVWWTKGADADLYDETLGEDAPAVLSCSELINTP